MATGQARITAVVIEGGETERATARAGYVLPLTLLGWASSPTDPADINQHVTITTGEFTSGAAAATICLILVEFISGAPVLTIVKRNFPLATDPPTGQEFVLFRFRVDVRDGPAVDPSIR